MKKNKVMSTLLVIGLFLAGCNNQGEPSNEQSATNNTTDTQDTNEASKAFVPELTVRFGNDGEPFVMHLYDNETARDIAGYVGSADWNLPIYHYDDYENYEVMQYYDIPDRYEIRSNAEQVNTQKAGEVYYSEPNRIVLFYQDAQVSGEYTKIGYFDVSDDFVDAVVNNPVVEGWSNKIVSISPAEE